MRLNNLPEVNTAKYLVEMGFEPRQIAREPSLLIMKVLCLFSSKPSILSSFVLILPDWLTPCSRLNFHYKQYLG